MQSAPGGIPMIEVYLVFTVVPAGIWLAGITYTSEECTCQNSEHLWEKLWQRWCQFLTSHVKLKIHDVIAIWINVMVSDGFDFANWGRVVNDLLGLEIIVQFLGFWCWFFGSFPGLPMWHHLDQNHRTQCKVPWLSLFHGSMVRVQMETLKQVLICLFTNSSTYSLGVYYF